MAPGPVPGPVTGPEQVAQLRRDLRRRSRADAVITGACDFPVIPSLLASFASMNGAFHVTDGTSFASPLVAGTAANIELEADWQGCRDGDICYPPQTWTETVTLKTARAKLQLGGVGGGKVLFDDVGGAAFPVANGGGE